MDLEAFLRRVTPPGIKYIGQLLPRSDRKGVFVKHDVVQNYEEMANHILHLHRNNAHRRDIYFALASFMLGLVEVNGKPRPARRQDNVDREKALWADLDCGPGKPYPTKADAATDLARWLKENDIIPPTIVNDSGGGLHVYWTFTEAIKYSRWRPLADALKVAGLKGGLKADWMCTADAARILRPPGTVNYKHNVEVKVVHALPHDIDPDRMAENLQRFMKLGRTGLGQGPGVAPGVNAALSNKTFNSARAYRVGPIVQQCNVMGRVAANHGADCAEPQWFKYLTLIAFCEDGAQWAHPLSDGYPKYTTAETEQKYAQAEAYRAKGPPNGPTTCARFEEDFAAECASCPLRGRITSPIVLGDKQDESLPWPYIRANGRIYRNSEKETKEGTVQVQHLVCGFDVEDVELAEDEEGQLCLYFTQVLSNTNSQLRKLPLALLYSSANNFSSEMANAKMVMGAHEQRKRFVEFMLTFAEQLHKAKERPAIRPQAFGWTEPDGKAGFSINGTTYWADGTESKTNIVEPIIQNLFHGRGKVEAWDKLAALMRPTMTPELEILLATAFAAPLVQLISPYSTLLCIRSDDTGMGKTAVMKLAQAVWGDPERAPMQLSDTTNAIAHITGKLGNLPIYWDEVRFNGNRDGVESGLSFLFQISQGREKRRLTQGAKARTTGMWHSMMVLTTNESIVQHIKERSASDLPALARVLEMSIDLKQKYNPAIDMAGNDLKTNYGQHGIAYAKFLAANRASVKTAAEKLIVGLSVLPEFQGNRFWSASVAALLLGAKLASTLGVYPFDLAALRARLIKLVTDSFTDVQDAGVGAGDLLPRFLEHNMHRRIVTDKLGAVGRQTRVVLIDQPRNTSEPVAFQVAKDDNKLVIPKQGIHSFAYGQNMTSHKVRRYLETTFGAAIARRGLATGTHFAMPQVWCYEIDIKGDLDWIVSGV